MSTLARKLALAFGTLLTGLVVVELVVRNSSLAAEPVNFTTLPKEIRRASTISGVRYMLAPEAEVVQQFGTDPRGYLDPGATLTYRINSLGFRGPETTVAKPPGTFRIVGLGDSFTFGEGVRQEDTFLAVLQAELGAGTEVLNFGVLGYDTEAEVNLLRFEALRFEPDLVVLCLFMNDAGGGSQHDVFSPRDEPDPGWWRRHVELVDVLATRAERSRRGEELMENYRRSFEPRAEGWVECKHALRRAAKLAAEHDFELVLAIHPVLWRLDEHPLAAAHAEVASFGRKLGLSVLDLHGALAGYEGPELWVNPANQHPSELAHALVGRALAGFLHQAGHLPERAPVPEPRQP